MKTNFDVVSLEFPTRVTLIRSGKEEGGCRFVKKDAVAGTEDTYAKIDFVMSIDKLNSLKGKKVLIKIPECIAHDDKKLNTDEINRIAYSELTGKSLEKLTSREKEILNRIANGNSNRDIANALYISLHTVKTHIYNIFKKLNVSNRMQAVMCKNNEV